MSAYHGTKRLDNEMYGRHVIKVLLTCEHELVDESTVKILNIEENFEGEDVVTFVCPLCNVRHKSRRFG